RAAVYERDRAAHRMADEREAVEPQCLDQRIQIPDIVGKVIIAAGADPAAVAVAAAVGRDDAPRRRVVILERVDEALPAARVIEKSVDQQQRLRRRIAPLEIMKLQAARIDRTLARRRHRTEFLSAASTKSWRSAFHTYAATRLTTRS